MTEDELQTIIRQAIAESAGACRRAARWWCSPAACSVSTTPSTSLQRLQATGVQLDYLQTPSALRILDQG